MSVSLVPFPAHQRHTFEAGGQVHEAVCRELAVTTPDDVHVAHVAHGRNLLIWHGEKGVVRSTAREVFDLARAGASGFLLGGGASA